MLSKLVPALIGATFGITSVVAGSVTAAPTRPIAAASSSSCEADLRAAVTGWKQCRADLKSCKDGLTHYPSLEEMMRRGSRNGGLTHRLLLEAVTKQAPTFTVPEAVSFEQAMIEEFARRVPTAEPEALTEMSTALEKVETQVVKTETLLKAAAAVE